MESVAVAYLKIQWPLYEINEKNHDNVVVRSQYPFRDSSPEFWNMNQACKRSHNNTWLVWSYYYRGYSSRQQIAYFKVTEKILCCNTGCGERENEYCLELAAQKS
jgi:hypothetical protein